MTRFLFELHRVGRVEITATRPIAPETVPEIPWLRPEDARALEAPTTPGAIAPEEATAAPTAAKFGLITEDAAKAAKNYAIQANLVYIATQRTSGQTTKAIPPVQELRAAIDELGAGGYEASGGFATVNQEVHKMRSVNGSSFDFYVNIHTSGNFPDVNSSGNATGTKDKNCFTGETLITMADGSMKPIRDIEQGDIILSYDLTTHTRTE